MGAYCCTEEDIEYETINGGKYKRNKFRKIYK